MTENEREETTEKERADWQGRADDAGRLARDYARLLQREAIAEGPRPNVTDDDREAGMVHDLGFRAGVAVTDAACEARIAAAVAEQAEVYRAAMIEAAEALEAIGESVAPAWRHAYEVANKLRRMLALMTSPAEDRDMVHG